ncbi:hypothetical protein [Paraferrimonas sp. SM1919]|uniref:hypothetical protein n=1 Tax=Paraferrimonas sp. SM1919 TaxID=2662263 RepID=UPI0013D0999C|nr:hypothetical protein [Paraferrimonas sp. SM1919]
MANILLKRDDKLSIKVSHQMKLGSHRRVDVFFTFPKDMDINPQTLPEEHYFNVGIKGRRSYFSDGLHQPLLHTRFASLNKEDNHYRTNVNLFAYQFAIANEIDTKSVLNTEEADELYVKALVLAQHNADFLKKFRRSRPTREKPQGQFDNADNYVSWRYYQQLLKLIAKAPRGAEYKDSRRFLLEFANKELEYRWQQGYQSETMNDDPNRLANKMRLLRRLIEYDVLFRQSIRSLGKTLKKFVTGFVTAMIAIVVLTLIIKTRQDLGVSAVMIGVLAIIYGLREVFKEDLRNILWKWLRKGKPKWSSYLFGKNSNTPLVKQKIWLDYKKIEKLPVEVQNKLNNTLKSRNHADYILHYRIESLVAEKGFVAGYQALQETLYFNLRPFTRYLASGTGELFQEVNGKVSKVAIEKRYQINAIVKMSSKKDEQVIKRYKINLTRSQIINIELAS